MNNSASQTAPDSHGYDDAGNPVPIASDAVSPEIELLNELSEIGATFPSPRLAVATVCDWIERHDLKRADLRLAFDERQIVQKILELVTAGDAGPLTAGIRAFALQHKLRLGVHRTARDLARKLKISPGRVSQIVSELNAELAEKPAKPLCESKVASATS